MTRFILSSLVILTGFSQLMTSAQADTKVYQQTLSSTAWVLAKTDGSTSSGTGVLVDETRKLLLTNFHVVGDARAAVVFFPEVTKGTPEVERDHYLKNVKKLGIRGRVLGVDRKRDLALIELDRIPAGIKAIKLAETSSSPGEDVQSVGNSGSTDALWVYTSGTVRSIYQKQFRTGAGDHDFKVLETQSPINPGDSGGPVVNANGELIGICQSLSPKARLVTYCVDISEVKTFLDSDWKPAPLPVVDVLEKMDIKFTTHESGHFEINFDQKNDKTQAVYITKDIEYYEHTDVRKVWSLAATLKTAPSTETMMKLLEQNARTKLGSWTVERNPNGEYLVIYLCKVDATSSSRSLKSTMEYVAKLTHIAQSDLTPKAETENAEQILSSWLSN